MKKNKASQPVSKVHSLFIIGVLVCFFLLIHLTFFKNKTKNEYHIAVLFPGSVPFFDIQINAIQSVANDLNIKITFFNANWNSTTQIQQLQNALSLNIDAIALATVDNKALRVAPLIVAEYNLPLLTFTNSIGSNQYGLFPNVSAHVGRDEVNAGKMLAKQIELLRGEMPTTIMLIQGAAGTTPQRLREKGFFERVSHHPTWKVINNVIINKWDSEKVEDAIKRIYHSNRLVDVIATQWPQASLSATHVIKNHAIKMDVVGLEFNSAIKKEMRQGHIRYATNFSIKKEGQLAIRTLLKIIKGEKTKRFISIKQVIVNAVDATQITPEY